MAAITQPTSNLGSNRSTLNAQFREIHKNTWLKRLSQEGKKITVGPKKSERSWVVFCVHDDTEAILEGYAEPRQAASHNPEWAISMQNTLHISHALIPNSNEFEFVVTLSNEVIRFHAISWEIMQEWVETLRSKLREMKILSPRENLYTKLPEIRPPLLPTRDPTSPLPLPPPVPAAIVPGVEIVMPPPHSNHQQQQQPNANTAIQQPSESVSRTAANPVPVTTASSDTATATPPTNNTPAMSNTSTQNLLNMLSDPISSYSEQLQGAVGSSNNLKLNTEQLSTSLNDLRLHQSATSEDEDCLSPLLRPGTSASIVDRKKRNSADQPKNVDKKLMQCDRLIPRPQTSRSQSAGAADKCKNSKQTINKASNITALEITTLPSTLKTAEAITTNNDKENTKSNITIIQVSTSDINSSETTEETAIPILPAKSSTTIEAEIFTFPESQDSNVPITNKTTKNVTNTPAANKHSDYKSHVQLIPSNSNVNSSTIQIIGETPTTSNFVTASNQYSTPSKKKTQQQQTENNQITTVHVGGGASVYGTCFTLPPSEQESLTSTPKLPKKIILSANTSGITNIKVDSHSSNRSPSKSQDTSTVRCNVGNVHYEKVFLSSSIPVTSQLDMTTASASVVARTTAAPASHTSGQSAKDSHVTPTKRNAHKVDASSNSTTPNTADIQQIEQISNATTTPATSSQQAASNRISKAVQTTSSSSTTTTDDISNKPVSMLRSPLVQRRATALRAPNMLTRGLTEAVIMRPSRRDLFASSTPKIRNNPMLTGSANRPANKSAVNNNENGSTSISSSSDVLDQRRRSSSTSDAAPTRAPPQVARPTRGSNNNELMSSGRPSAALRFQQPPQPFRNMENGLLGSAGLIGAAGMSPPPLAAAAASKRLTLREQQIMQLRREIMHPGGVRLQLRRKDCIGSIAWIEAFGAVWVAGWKQKEHPVLYNALHIGDQLLSIAGVSISSAAEANKIIRNTNTLFVELLIRRMPFGCGIAIRRDREGQCLGLIRDGNTATIVDVVPNSLAARHGLPPKTQACDGSSLTFWVLTEINGRPLNLFFKDNEIRDRLNSVGRDISILVQPSDLITKLKKQLKSLRGYKDYLVQ